MAGTAIVLSGGGAKGDFEVGAVRALYDRGIVPNILVGTSVGAINATKLAEGEDPADPSRGLAGLEGIWASLRVDEDMSVPAAWLKDPNLDPELAAALMGTGDVGAIGASAPGPTSGPNVLGAVWLLTDGRRLLESLKVVASSSCLFTLEPIRQKAFSSLDLGKVAQWSARGGRLRLATVSMDTGALRYVTETGALVERDQTTPVADLTHIPAGCQTLIDAIADLETQITALQGDIADAPDKSEVTTKIWDLRDQQAQLREDFDRCVARNPIPAQVDLRNAAVASSAIPVIFPMEWLAGQAYVDGGVREVVPAQAAIDLGADDIYAVSASPIGLRRASFRGARIGDIASRMVDLLLAEVVRDDLRTSADGLRLIAPDEEVHGMRTIDPGLIQINRDYGYMRASDVLGGVDPASDLWGSATEITRMRVAIWDHENKTAGQPDSRFPGRTPSAPDPSLAADTQARKDRLGQRIAARRAAGGGMPADIDRWITGPELHRWLTPAPPPPPPPPTVPTCDQLAAEIQALEQDLSDQQADLATAAPGEKAAINRKIAEISDAITQARTQARNLGCPGA